VGFNASPSEIPPFLVSLVGRALHPSVASGTGFNVLSVNTSGSRLAVSTYSWAIISEMADNKLLTESEVL